MNNNFVAVVGGANIDIGGIPYARLIEGDSNPGTVCVSAGGVGRNIAENLARLGTRVELIAAFGDDAYAAQLRSDCAQNGIGLAASLTIHGARSSVYLFIDTHEASMALAVADMEIYEAMTPERLASALPCINSAAVCVVDTNVPLAALEFLCERCTVPIFADPVSVTKAEKLKKLLPAIHTIKPNRAEAELLSGMPIRNDDDLHAAADILLERGLRHVFISLGTRGLLYAGRHKKIHIPSKPVAALNATGAGDSAMAALVWSFLSGLPPSESGKNAAAAAELCMESPDTVSKTVSAAAVRARAKRKIIRVV